MHINKIITFIILIVSSFAFIIPIQVKAEKVTETIYDYKRIEDYTVKKDGILTGWKWKKKKSTLIGIKYQWNKNGKAKKVKRIVIKHPYIKNMSYGDDKFEKGGVYCGYEEKGGENWKGFYRNDTGIQVRQRKKRIYLIFHSYSENKYYYLVVKERGKLLYDGEINFEQIIEGENNKNPERQNISDVIILDKNKFAITYQIQWKAESTAISGVDYINIKTKQTKRLFRTGTQTYTILSYDGKRIFAVASESKQKKLYIINSKNKKVIMKVKIPNTKLKLPKTANEIYDEYSKRYRAGLCKKKIYYLDNLKGLFVCNLKKREIFQKIKGKYSYVNYKYSILDEHLRCFQNGKKTIIYVTYLTYGRDEHFEEGEADLYCKLVRYDIS